MFTQITTRRRSMRAGTLLAVVALVAGCSGDDDAAEPSAPSVESEAAEQAEAAGEDAEEVLDDALASVPSMPGEPRGEPSDDDSGISIPSADRIEEIGECFGIDLGELGDFDELEQRLDELDDLDLGSVPGSLPSDIFDDLGDVSEMTPEEIETLLEERLAELEGALSSVPDISLPSISIPDLSAPSLPFDREELEECLDDAAES
jgi:hypothetical protein